MKPDKLLGMDVVVTTGNDIVKTCIVDNDIVKTCIVDMEE